jgi:hypothetical protein
LSCGEIQVESATYSMTLEQVAGFYEVAVGEIKARRGASLSWRGGGRGWSASRLSFAGPWGLSSRRRRTGNRPLIWLYRPVIRLVLHWRWLTVAVAIVVLGAAVYPVSNLGIEFMPQLNEGTFLYMPVTLPGISVTKAAELLQTQDKIIKSFPEVASEPILPT